MREGGFPAGTEPLDEGGARAAAGVRLDRASPDIVFTSPATAARETAAALGLAVMPDERLRDMDNGRWTGLSFAEVHVRDPDGLATWLADPEAGTPEGERLDGVRARVDGWLSEQAGRDGSILAITHPMVIRAALSACLALPLSSVLRFDIAPLSATTLSYNRQWRLQSLGQR